MNAKNSSHHCVLLRLVGNKILGTIRLTVRRQALMVTVAMDKTETPPSKVKRMTDSKGESYKPESNITDGLNRQTNFKWLRKFADRSTSGQTGTEKIRFEQTNTKGKLKPSDRFEAIEQVTTAQALEASTTPKVQPLSWVSVVKNGLSLTMPQRPPTGFISSFVPTHTINPRPDSDTTFQANNLTPNAEPGTKLHGNSHTTDSKSGTGFPENCHMTHSGQNAVLQSISHMTYNSIGSMLSSMAATQPQLVNVPSMQPVMSCLSNSQVWSASSTQKTFFQDRPSPTVGCWGSQISREYSSQSSSAEIHLSADGQTCPELTSTPRCWHTIKQSDSNEVGSLEFTVMSYNILSQELMVRHMELYNRCTESDLVWETRGIAILTQIIAHNADIICLQEVQKDHWNQDIRHMLAVQGYRGVYKKQEGEKPDGCAILFKVSKFRKFKFVPVEFMKGGILDRSNVGIILLLRPRQAVYGGSTRMVCVATTHLLFNPKRGDIKLAQLVLFLAEIDKHAYQQDDIDSKLSQSDSDYTPHTSSSFLKNHSHGSDGVDIPDASMGKEESRPRHHYCPIILCGDFNSEPFSDLYKFITTGHLKYDQLVSRLVCGQKEGQQWGTNRTIDKILLPKELSISETCQYITVLNRRQSAGYEASQHPKINSGEVFHGMNFQSVYRHYVGQPGQRQKEVSSHHNNCSCTVDYIFYSTSRARQQQWGPSVDTEDIKSGQCHDSSLSDSQQGTSSTADSYKETDMIKEPLELLARYSLLTTKEVTRFGPLPNATLPSDHLCLIARFLLR